MDLKERNGAGARRHPWETVRFDFFSRLVRESVGDGAGLSILDVGAGDAWFASRLLAGLAGSARITCWDSGYSDEVSSDLRHDVAGPGDGVDLVAERPAETFDLVLFLDVLEHVADDRSFLAEIVEHNLAPGARALISVPAWPALYTSHDERLQHHRRYRPREGLALVASAGLDVVLRGGLFPSLLPVRAAGALRERWLGPRLDPESSSLAWDHGAAVSWAVEAALQIDARASRWLARRGAGVTGLSWWALCEKPPRP
jgi:SAM-dependent methyltransferase